MSNPIAMHSTETVLLLAEFSSAVRIQTLKRLEEVPEGFMNWRLNDTAMSFADIVQHLINVDELFFELLTDKVIKFQWQLGVHPPHMKVDDTVFGKLLEKLRSYRTKRHDLISCLSSIQLQEQLTDENGEKMTLWWYIMRQVLEHEIYHRGQIAAYLKVLKGEPY